MKNPLSDVPKLEIGGAIAGGLTFWLVYSHIRKHMAVVRIEKAVTEND